MCDGKESGWQLFGGVEVRGRETERAGEREKERKGLISVYSIPLHERGESGETNLRIQSEREEVTVRRAR